MKKTVGIIMAFVTGLVLFGGGHVQQAQAAEMNFAVTANIPDNQIDKRQTFFNLKMKPNQKQDITVTLKNATSKDVVVMAEANSAMTNDNGVVEYSQVKPKLDKTMTNPLSSIVKSDTEVTVPAKKSVVHTFHITMPAKQYDGEIDGGLYFYEKIDKDSESKSKSNVQIKNRYAFVIGTTLTETESVVKPDMKLLGIEPGSVNFRNTLKVNLQNPTMTPIRNLKVDGKVYSRNGSKVLFASTTSNMTLAPNTNFNYGIFWNNQPFAPGKYRLEMTATSGANKWKWNENFTIDGAAADKLNKKAVNLEHDYTMWYILAGVLLILLVLLIIWFLARRRNKKDKEDAIEEAKRQIMAEMQTDDKEDK
ncbi:DUF916 and DUF3324 domain-containing protein [Dellaglioa algida]|uniref:DUF916 and DUF3324 domain-containing protein n=1 Tax=Dellaglioa algida TaxID=105612 RepID=UPI0024C4D734|nr:DUF916 and DUF3324 domain-containing protein [Dellaglioa algida]MDK1725978.1 DUF916 and DUF3324 domain-containing protein [Dellaglioa algida]MDK1725991.1 DUF916 and DUF3324 domain-containing protein [Dellaglioa algida]